MAMLEKQKHSPLHRHLQHATLPPTSPPPRDESLSPHRDPVQIEIHAHVGVTILSLLLY